MADYLLKDKFKDAAAVMAGGVLEEHIRKLCTKNSIDVNKPDGGPKATENLNIELAKVSAYSKNEQKQVTAWLSIRNSAAHGKYSEYSKENVELFLQGLRDFINRFPA